MQNFSEIKRGVFAQIGFEYVEDSRAIGKKQTFRKKSKSNFFEKSLSPKGNFRRATAPLLLEIELR
jgi:hypothetical protein